MDRKIIYFINPIAGTRSKENLSETLKTRTARENIPFEILHTDINGNYTYLADKINTEQITDIVICGGDGTVNQIAASLTGIPINIGIIPMGSGNGLAFAANIPKRIDKALDVVFAGKADHIDGFYINNKFSCMLCGLGFDAQVAHNFAAQKKRGLATYIKQTGRHFLKASAYPFDLILEGKTISTDAFFISIANSNQFGNNFTIAPQASLQDGLLDIVVVNKMNKLQMIWKILKQIRTGKVRMYDDKKYHRKGIHYFQARKISITNPTLAPLHIDGDPAETAAYFEIEVIEKAIRLLMP